MHRHRHHKHFACKLCGENLSGEIKLKRHVKTIHKGEMPQQFTCPEEGCGEKFFFNSDLSQHTRSEHKPADCPYCDLKMKNEMALWRHVKSKHTLSQCVQCNKQFTTDGSLAKHIQVAHKKTFECVQCYSKFSSKEDLKVHHRMHLKLRRKEMKSHIECKQCSKELSRANFKNHIRMHQKEAEANKSAGWPECGLCGKKYFKRGNVKRHIFTVHLEEIDQEDFKKHIMPGQAEFGWKERKDKLDEDNKSGWPECGLCGKKYPTRQIVKKHIFTVHLEEMDHEDFKKHIIPVQEEFECEQCKKKFSKKERLERHARVYHMEEFKCEKCGKRFSRKENLIRHITVRQELKFECELCHEKFSLRCEKMRHLKNEHEIEAGDEAKMKCEVCDRKLKRCDMKDHMKRKHKIEYVECAQCGETFNNKTKLETHKSLVHVVKLQCDLCDEEFELNEALAAHKDLDHREFKCDEQGCGFKTKTEADLRNHTNQHYLESGQLWLIKRYIM